jgi:hypothetical protein
MDAGERRELRQWSDRLCQLQDPERRAMGRAIAMLLNRIDELEDELALSRPPVEEPVLVPAPPPLLDPVDPASAGEDTQQLTLRDRLRLATDHLRGDQRR